MAAFWATSLLIGARQEILKLAELVASQCPDLLRYSDSSCQDGLRTEGDSSSDTHALTKEYHFLCNIFFVQPAG